MDTPQPTLRLADGTLLVGSFEETVGTQVVLSGPAPGSSSHQVQLLGHTDRSIHFRKPPAEEEASEGGADDSTERGGGAAGPTARQQQREPPS
jgi:hypothetical protein